MAFVVPLGQYVPGISIIHRLDTRIKLLIAVAYIVAVFAVSTWLGLALCVIILAGSYLIARISFPLAIRGLRPVFYILGFTVIINLFTFNATPDTATLPLFGSFGISLDGFLRGLFFALRIVLLTSMTSLLTYTSTLLNLADALNSILRPLKILKVPVEDIAVVFTITLRFIPLTVEEANKIMTAQRARGVKFDSNNILKRAKSWIPVIIPLFVTLFRRADHLAAAMETRCYTGKDRTHLRATKLKPSHAIAGTATALALIALGIFG